MHRVDLASVYVLHTRPFQNTSLIVELFSKQYGRISVVARSARGPKSRYQGQLQLFTPILASWSGRHELKTLGQIELNGCPIQLNQTPLFCGFYFNELLMRLLHKEDAHPNLFDIYHRCLCRLENNETVSTVLRYFEKKLLEDLGYALPLIYEAKTHLPIEPTVQYQFVPNQGFFPCDPIMESTTSFLGSDLMAIGAEQFDIPSVSIAAKRLMRMALSVLLGNQPLNSRVLF